MHPVLIIIAKVLFDTVPGVTQETSWTLVSLCYMMVRYFRGPLPRITTRAHRAVSSFLILCSIT